MRALGVELLILSNASGGMNPGYRSGDVMVIEDHINLMGQRGKVEGRDSEAGFPCPNSRRYYCPQLIDLSLASARRGGFAAHRGIYAAMTGPNYETRAEYRMLRALGADAVGMSTVPEAVVAAQCGLRVLALSTITNICLPDRLTPARHEDVLAAAASAEPKVRRIVMDVVAAVAGPQVCGKRPSRRSVAQVDGAVPVGTNGTSHNGAPQEAIAELPSR
jgi:purine-nucleoside phosphorylase